MVANGSMKQAAGSAMANWHVFEDRDTLVTALKSDIETMLRAALQARGHASWAVSGGSTPQPLFEAMQQSSLDWQKVDVALVDERWVPFEHARSNEAFVADSLMKGRAASACLVGMKTAHDHAHLAVSEVNRRYASVADPFDSILLGLGPDAHTASLFPGADGLEEAFAPDAPTCVALKAIKSNVTGNELERMSLSAAAIAKAPHVTLMITGEEKKTVLEQALNSGGSTPVARLHEMKPFEIYWAP